MLKHRSRLAGWIWSILAFGLAQAQHDHVEDEDGIHGYWVEDLCESTSDHWLGVNDFANTAA